MTTGINFTLTGVDSFRTNLTALIQLGKQYDQVFKQATLTTKNFQQALGKGFSSRANFNLGTGNQIINSSITKNIQQAGRSIGQNMTKGLKEGEKEFKQEFEGMQNRTLSSVVDFSRRLGFIGFQFTALGSIFGGALALSAREAIEFESSITSVIQRLDRSDPLFASFKASISKDIRALGTDAFINGQVNVLSGLENSQNQLAQISALGSQLGVPIKNLEEFTKVIGEFSIANQELSAEEASTFFARFSNIVFPEGATTEQFRGLANDLVFLSNTMAATAPEIANQALRLAAIGSQIGFTPAETLGLSGVLASIGVKPEAGGTATIQLFDKIFESISDINTITLTGAQRSAGATEALNEKLLERQELTLEIATAEERLSRTKLPALFKEREFDIVQQRAELASLNAEISSLQSNISGIVSQGTVSVTNASEEAKFLANLLGISPQALADLFRTSPAEGTTALIQAFGTAQNRDELIGWLAELGITGTRAKQVIAGLSEAGVLLEEAFTDANEAFEDTTYLTEIAEERFNTTEAQLNLLANAFRDLQIEIGDKMLPTIKDAIQILVPLFDLFKQLSPEILEATLVFGGLTLGAGALFTALSFLVNPLTLVIGLLGTLAVGFVQNFDTISAEITKIIPEFEIVKNIIQDITKLLFPEQQETVDGTITTSGFGGSSLTTFPTKAFEGSSRADFLRKYFFPDISQKELLEVIVPAFDELNALTEETIFSLAVGQEVKIPLPEISFIGGATGSSSTTLVSPEDLQNFGQQSKLPPTLSEIIRKNIIGTDLEELLNDLNNNIFPKLSTIATNIKLFFDEITRPLKDETINNLNKIGGLFGGLIEAVFAPLGEIDILSQATVLSNNLGNAGNIIRTALEDFSNDIFEALFGKSNTRTIQPDAGFGFGVGSLVVNTGQGSSTPLTMLIEQLTSAFGEADKEKAIAQIGTSLGSFLSTVILGGIDFAYNDLLPKISEAFGFMVGGIVGAIVIALQAVYAMLADFYSGTGTSQLPELTRQFGESLVKNVIEPASKGLAEGLSLSLGEDFTNLTPEQFAKKLDVVISLRLDSKQLEADFNALIARLGETLLGSDLYNFIHSVDIFLGNPLNQAQGTISSFTDFETSIGDAIKAQNFVPSPQMAGIDYFENLVLSDEIPYQFSVDFIEGLAKGLEDTDANEKVKSSASSSANKLLETFSTTLGTESPSYITEQMGFDLMEGLAIGILNNLDAVLNPIQLIIDRVDLLSKAFTNLAIIAGINMFAVSIITTTFLNPLTIVFDRLTIAATNFEKVLAGIAGTMGLIVNAGVPIQTLVGASIASGNLTAETGGFFGKGSFVEVLENGLPFEAMSIGGRSFLMLNDNASIYSPRGSGQFGLSAPTVSGGNNSSQSIYIDNLSIGIDGSKNAIDVANQVVETIRNSAKIGNVRKIQQLS